MKKSKESKRVRLSRAILVLCIMSFCNISIMRAETLSAFMLQTQTKKVTGTVFDDQGLPIEGANVIAKGTSIGTTTDENGAFSIDINAGVDVLQFTFIGMESKEVNVKGKTNITVTLSEEQENLDEIVLIGYQSVQKKTVTAAVSTVKAKDIENVPYASVDQILAGKVAGLVSLSTSGEPGANTVTNIRGSNSVTLGGVSYPLYVIDGMVYDVNDMPSDYGNNPLTAINPNDIESIDVLKDASAAAIYGSRGANGVILIKTKTGSLNQKPTFRLNAYTGMGMKPKLRSTIGGRLERQLKLDAIYQNYGNLNQENASMFLTDSLNVAFNNSTDWQDLFIQNSTIHNVDASVSGAFGENEYRVSLGYYNEEGVIKGYALNRISPKLYLKLNPSEKVNVTVNFAPSLMDVEHGMGDGSTFPFSTWAFPSSNWKLTDELKQIYTGNTETLDEDKTVSLMSNTRLNIKATKNLLFSSSFSYNYRNNRRDWLQLAGFLGQPDNIAISNTYQTTITEIENFLTYTKSFNDVHNISAVLGQQASSQTNKRVILSGVGVLGNTVYDLAPGSGLSGESYMDTKRRLGVFGRLNYNYKEKYLFSSSFRRDASSRYGKSNRWTTFYSADLGWIPSEEAFFEPITDVVNFLKFRASYGVTGNDPASYYAQYNIYTGNSYYDGASFGLNNYAVPTTYNGTTTISQNYSGYAGSKDVTWEKYPQVNIGVDFSLFDNRIQVNANWYARDGEDIFYSNLVAPSTSAYQFYSGNAVSIRNTGYDFTINTINLGPKSKLQWNSTITLGLNDNYVTKLPNGGKDLTVGVPWLQYTLTQGQPLFSYRVWNIDGVYAKDEDVPVDPLTGNVMTYYGISLKAGDPIYEDLNGDYNIDANDKDYKGTPNPKLSGGIINTFNYKNWSLSVFCNFITGRKIWNGYISDKLNGSKSIDPWVSWGNRATLATLQDINYYTGPGDTDADYGTIVNNKNTIDRFHIANSKFIEDGSFFRIKNINLGYTVPGDFAKKIGFSSLRVYGMIDNVAIFTKSTLPDPEAVGADGFSAGNNYPLAMKFTTGLTASF